MKNILKNRYFVVILPILQVLITIVLYNRLPNDMPMQVSLSGSVNWTMPKLYELGCFRYYLLV